MRPTSKRLIIVRRGATELFEYLEARFAGDPRTKVLFDRRTDERRVGVDQGIEERRRSQRRAPLAPSILEIRGFLVTRTCRVRGVTAVEIL